MTHYGYIGYRSMGTPELRPTEEHDTDWCDHCSEKTQTFELERNLEEHEEFICDACAEEMEERDSELDFMQEGTGRV